MIRQQNKNKFTPETLKKDLDLDRRAFFREYAKDLKGPGKMVVLAFFITKGENKSIGSDEIKKQWNKVESILEKHNPAYLLRAREYGFLKEDEAEKKHYKLTNKWLERLIQKYFKNES